MTAACLKQTLAHLEIAIACATNVLEDNLYWIGLSWREEDDAAISKVSTNLFVAIPWPLRKLGEEIVRRGMCKILHCQDMGRNWVDEMSAIGRHGIVDAYPVC